MIKKESRLTSDQEFQEIFRTGQKINQPNLVAYFKAGSAAKFGVVVSNKACPQAVKRNRLKRQTRAFWQEHQADVRAGQLVIVIKKYLEGEKLRNQLTELFKKLDNV